MQLNFIGNYGPGASRFTDEIDLRAAFPNLKEVSGWPTVLVAGTFNIDVDTQNWPSIKDLDFQAHGVKCLDRCEQFPPSVYLNYSVVPNNTLNPNRNGQYGGDLQFWCARLMITGEKQDLNCYMLRRVHSGYRTKIEIVSDIHISSRYNIEHGHPVRLLVFDGLKAKY